MNSKGDVRKQVMAQIISVMAEAEADGRDAIKAASRAFPGTPGMILGEAYGELMIAEADAWWERIERTIDGEIIRNAIVVTASEPAEAGPRDVHLDEAFEALATSAPTEGSTAWPA